MTQKSELLLGSLGEEYQRRLAFPLAKPIFFDVTASDPRGTPRRNEPRRVASLLKVDYAASVPSAASTSAPRAVRRPTRRTRQSAVKNYAWSQVTLNTSRHVRLDSERSFVAGTYIF